MPQVINGQTISDFRSDTVTQPTPAMREAMAAAVVGDDVFGDDPTVNALQEEAAALFGKEAALFVPSGTMGNLIALKLHTEPGDEVLFERNAHMFNCEGGGSAWVAGVQARTLDGPLGRLDPDEVRQAIRKDDPHFPRTRLLAIENTHNFYGGRIVPLDHLKALRAVADERGLKVHIDGARIMNAAVASDTAPAQYGAIADTIMFCLSKGLGAPIGSLLVGSRDDIGRAHRIRKALGGGMRQVGVVAAPGLLALRDGPAQLALDHAHARQLAEGLAAIDTLEVDVVACETNILFVKSRAGPAAAERLTAALAERGVWAIALGALGIRFVTHRHVDDSDVARAVAAVKAASR